ncbi:MAG: hypothetical protein ACPGNT_02185 [Rhodospirillales bacterium]
MSNPFARPARMIRRFAELKSEHGLGEALRLSILRYALRAEDTLPLARVNRAGLFRTDPDAIHAEERQQIRASSLVVDASRVEQSYPEVFEAEGRFLRYGFKPARGRSQGLVVLFHGHDAFLHMGPMKAWETFDLLAPWDTFGFQRQGSWFWGEKGDNATERLIQGLIAQVQAEKPGLPWFATGGSMGGFGALYHGIKHGASGLYVVCPQVDIAAKITEYGRADLFNPYGYLQGEAESDIPDLLALAGASPDLPPLFLIQNQFDHVNPFAEHAQKLVDIYNAKRGWLGLRVHPSIGHGGDGRQEEAEMFFSLIVERNPPRRADFG